MALAVGAASPTRDLRPRAPILTVTLGAGLEAAREPSLPRVGWPSSHAARPLGNVRQQSQSHRVTQAARQRAESNALYCRTVGARVACRLRFPEHPPGHAALREAVAAFSGRRIQCWALPEAGT